MSEQEKKTEKKEPALVRAVGGRGKKRTVKQRPAAPVK